MPAPARRRAAWLLAALLSACTAPGPPEAEGEPAREDIVAVSESHHLLRFNAGQPQRLLERRPLAGLPAAERLLGIDYRGPGAALHALGATGQRYRIDIEAARALPIGSAVVLPAVASAEWGYEFDPTQDRLRVANDAGVNLTLHPDEASGPAALRRHPDLAYDADDVNAGSRVRVVALAATHNKLDPRITTLYALDGATGMLVTLGSAERSTPYVSPNSGRLFSVGALGIGPFDHASFDISHITPAAYAGLRRKGEGATRWYRVDLGTGRARFMGTVGGREGLIGAAIEP